MANASIVNSTLPTTGETFNAIWKLTRALKSAGWRYKASGNGQAFNLSTIASASTTYSFSNGSPTVSVTQLTGTFNVGNNSANVTASTSQTGLIVPGSQVVFASQAGVVYTINTVAGTAITLTGLYTGTTNAATTAIPQTSIIIDAANNVTVTNGSTAVTSSSTQSGIIMGSVVQFQSQPGVSYTIATVNSVTSCTLTTPYTGSTTGGTNFTQSISALVSIVGNGLQITTPTQVGVTYAVSSYAFGVFTLATNYTGTTSTTSVLTLGAKDTSANSYLDQWSNGGMVNLTNVPGGGSGTGTGVALSYAQAASGLMLITGVTGFSSANSPNRVLTISGAQQSASQPSANISVNGSWRIVAATTTTVTIYCPGAVQETANASLTVTEQYGGATGSITTFSTVTSGQSPLINFTVTGFSGFTSSDVGRLLFLSGASSGANNGSFVIASVVSGSNVLLYNPSAVASDTNNGAIQWTEFDPKLETYPYYIQSTSGEGCWTSLQGPTIMKIPFGSNAVTGSFIRGENVTQSTTGAQGEVLGVVQDTVGGTGYMVVAPRVLGTGAQSSSVATYGWNNTANTDTITGILSGATVTTPVSSTPIAYIREMVFWKGASQSSGHIYYQCIDQNSSTESATTAVTGRFSTMASLVTCTPILCPGGSSTGVPTTNGFPTTGTCVFIGTGGAGAFGTGAANLPGILAPTTPGRFHALVANNIEQQGVSADGSWSLLQSDSSKGYEWSSFQRLDNQEDGDLDPYVLMCNCTSAATRTVATTSAGTAPDTLSHGSGWIGSNASAPFRGFRRRGLGNSSGTQGAEGFNIFSAAYLVDATANISGAASASAYIVTNLGYPDELATSIVTTYVREPLWAMAYPTAGTPRGRKGTARWVMMTIGVSVNSTLDSGRWLVCSSTNAPLIVGPWDGSSIPTF